jgi:peptidyl-prolyl cis-trans isomerase SurA
LSSSQNVPVHLRYSATLTVSTVLLAAGLISFSVTGCHPVTSSEVMATVNGKQIMQAEVDRIYKQSLGESAQAPSKEEAAIQRLNILKGMIQDEILQQRAAKLNLVATDEEVDAKLTDMKALSTQEEFDRQLKEKNLTLDELRREIRRTLTKNKLVNKEVESKVNITDAEISNYYNAHKSDFNLIEPQYHLERIVVTNEPSQQTPNLQNNTATTDADATTKVQMLRNRLDSGEDFGSVAARFSEDPNSSSNNGDIGFIYESNLQSDSEVYNAISKLKAGQVTDTLPIMRGEGPNKKTVGYQIFLLVEKRPAGQRELNDPRVQQGIRQLLRNNHAQLLENAYSEMLYNEAKIHNFLAEQILRDGAK